MKLLYFEWRKFVLRKHVFVFLLILSLLDISKILLDKYQGEIDILYTESVDNKKAYEEMYSKIKGEITEKKIQFIERERERLGEIYDKKLGSYIEGEKTYSGNLYEDYRIFKQYIYDDFERCVQYKEYSIQLEKLAKNNVDFYMKMDNVAGRKENQFIAKTYNDRKIKAYYRMENFEGYFSYTFSSVLIVIMCILSIAPMYVFEREINMWDVLETTYIGRRHCGIVKVFASMIYASIIVFWFRMLDYFTYCFMFDMEGIENPIWSVKGFSESPLNCNIISYALYDIGMKVLAVCVIVLAVLLLSLCVDKIIHVTIGIAILFGIWLLMVNGIDSLDWWIKGLGMCSPLLLMDCSRLFSKFLYIEIGDNFVQGEILAELSSVCIIVLELIGLLMLEKRGLKERRKL